MNHVLNRNLIPKKSGARINTIGYFDLETQNLFQDIYPEYITLPFKERTHLNSILIPQLRVSIAGVKTVDLQNNIVNSYVYTEENIGDLIHHLMNLDMIIGYNICKFDYEVLRPYTTDMIIADLCSKSFDFFLDLIERTGNWIRLNDLGKLNVVK